MHELIIKYLQSSIPKCSVWTRQVFVRTIENDNTNVLVPLRVLISLIGRDEQHSYSHLIGSWPLNIQHQLFD